MPASAMDVVRTASQHTMDQLFKPFRLGQWTRLAVTGLLAGELSTSGGIGFRFPSIPRNSSGAENFLAQSIASPRGLLLAVLPFLVLLGIGLLILFIYISSRMRFVLFDSVVAKECHIRRFWNQRREPGFRYFLWNLAFIFAMIGGFVTLAGACVGIVFGFGWQRNPREHLIPLIIGGIIVALIFIAFLVLVVVIAVLTKDFVVPQMALEDISAVQGWQRLWSMLKTEKTGYAGYIGLKILLSIAAMVGLGIAALIVTLVVLVPFGLLGVIAVFGGKALGLAWNVLTISAAVLAGCVAFATILYAVLLLTVPTIVFFPAYSIYFFAPRYEPLIKLLSTPQTR